MTITRTALILTTIATVCACAKQEAPPPRDVNVETQAQTSDAGVTAAMIVDADNRPGEWLSHGRTYSEQRFSPLKQINKDNVADLGLAWSYDLGESRGIEATPIIHDGVMYVTGSWDVVHAIDAKSGEKLWSFDPHVDKSQAAVMCCDIVNRGVAIWGDKVFIGTIDGRLIAVNAKTGDKVWDVSTIDKSKPYSITGAPRVIKGKVIIGNGGAEMGVRGYITAYDADTGNPAWRFYTVPGDPAKEPEDKAMALAMPTWTGEWWKIGGGGTVWDSMAYDPDLDLLYIGVGNGSPWNQKLRSPEGGDNLFLSSIVALRPETGEYVWHYQTTPGETWDYTACQHMILADMTIGGKARKVIMQAPKNGFFYVLDRKTGELISARNYVPVNWATHIDMKTGRPVEIADARWPGKAPYLQLPGPLGGHNWQPMSYDPETGLVYIPAQEVPFGYGEVSDFKYHPMGWNTGADFVFGSAPSDEATFKALRAMLKGRLLAWDPVRQKAAWSAEQFGPWNGGVLSTAGGLVFQGTSDAHFVAYDARSGEQLWSYFTQTGIVAAPVSYEIDGEQYVAVAAGWGGAYALFEGGVVPTGGEAKLGRVLTFKLGGESHLPPPPDISDRLPKPPPSTASPDVIAAGMQAYMRNCAACHGDHAMSSGLVPNLRYSPLLADPEGWQAVVRGGARADLGMGDFSTILSADDSEAIRDYVISEANSGHDESFYRVNAKTDQ